MFLGEPDCTGGRLVVGWVLPDFGPHFPLHTHNNSISLCEYEFQGLVKEQSLSRGSLLPFNTAPLVSLLCCLRQPEWPSSPALGQHQTLWTSFICPLSAFIRTSLSHVLSIWFPN